METEERKEEGTPSGETLEAAFGKLDQMLETLESSDVSLEDSFRLYKEGMELLNECSQKIDRVEKKMLQMNEDGTFREFLSGTRRKNAGSGKYHCRLPAERGRLCKGTGKSHELQYDSGRKEASSAAFAGEFPSVRRNRGGCKTIYGSHGDDSHPFPDPR